MIERVGVSRIAENLPFHKEKQPNRTIVLVLARIFMPQLQVKGKENIQEAIRLINEKGYTFFMMANHISHVDAPAITEALRRNRFRDLEKKSVFVAGMKLKKFAVTRFYADSQNIIWVWPKKLEPKDEKEEKIRSEMLRETIMSIRRTQEQGYNIVIFPEGTRSRDGKLQEGEPVISHYLNENTLVLPISIIGTEKVHAPGRPFFLPWQPTLIFGKPIEISSILTNNPNLTKDEKNRMIIGEIMKQIASNLPPKRRGFYA